MAKSEMDEGIPIACTYGNTDFKPLRKDPDALLQQLFYDPMHIEDDQIEVTDGLSAGFGETSPAPFAPMVPTSKPLTFPNSSDNLKPFPSKTSKTDGPKSSKPQSAKHVGINNTKAAESSSKGHGDNGSAHKNGNSGNVEHQDLYDDSEEGYNNFGQEPAQKKESYTAKNRNSEEEHFPGEILLMRSARQRFEVFKQPYTKANFMAAARILYRFQRSETPMLHMVAINVHNPMERTGFAVQEGVDDESWDLNLAGVVERLKGPQSIIRVVRLFENITIRDGRNSLRHETVKVDLDRNTHPPDLQSLSRNQICGGDIQPRFDAAVTKLLTTGEEPVNAKNARLQVARYQGEWLDWTPGKPLAEFLTHVLWKIDDPCINVYPCDWEPEISFEESLSTGRSLKDKTPMKQAEEVDQALEKFYAGLEDLLGDNSGSIRNHKSNGGALAYALWEVLNRQKGQPSTEQAQLLPQQFTGIGSGQDDLQSGPLTGATLGVFHGVADLSLIEQRQQIQRQIELLRDREKKADETARTLWLATEEALPANTEASLQRRIGYVNDQEKKLREDELRINHREQQLLQDEKRLSQLQSTLKDHPSRTASGQPLDPGMPTILDQLRFLEQRELDVGRQEVALREERAMLQKLAKEEGIKAEQFRAKYQNGGTKCPHPGCSAKAGSTIEDHAKGELRHLQRCPQEGCHAPLNLLSEAEQDQHGELHRKGQAAMNRVSDVIANGEKHLLDTTGFTEREMELAEGLQAKRTYSENLMLKYQSLETELRSERRDAVTLHATNKKLRRDLDDLKLKQATIQNPTNEQKRLQSQATMAKQQFEALRTRFNEALASQQFSHGREQELNDQLVAANNELEDYKNRMNEAANTDYVRLQIIQELETELNRARGSVPKVGGAESSGAEVKKAKEATDVGTQTETELEDEKKSVSELRATRSKTTVVRGKAPAPQKEDPLPPAPPGTKRYCPKCLCNIHTFGRKKTRDHFAEHKGGDLTVPTATTPDSIAYLTTKDFQARKKQKAEEEEAEG